MRALARLQHVIVRFALVVLVLCAPALVAIPATAATTGGISGTVTSSGTGLPGISVSYYALGQWGWQSAGWTQTDAQGDYAFGELPAGRYRVCFDDTAGTYLDECWNDKATVYQAEDIPVVVGAASDADAVLVKGSRIAGSVTSANAVGIGSIQVNVQQWAPSQSSWSGVASAQTSSDGTYEVSGLRTGTYRVCFYDSYGNTYVNECWNDAPTVQQALDIPVGEGERVGDINAVLATEARISGTVKDSDGVAIPNLSVSIRQKSPGDTYWGYVRSGQTDSSGTYEIGGLRAGTYRVCFESYGSNFLGECWNDKPTADLAQDVVVTAGERVTGKDAVLARAGHITGRLTDLAGTGLSGISVSVQEKTADSMMPWRYVSSATSDGSGNYDVGNLPAGTYRVCFQTWSHLAECWNDQPTIATATDISVAEGAVVAGRNATLIKEARLLGTVKDISGSPLTGVYVTAYARNTAGEWTYSGSTSTGPNGSYQIGGLRPGTYRMCFNYFSSSSSTSTCWQTADVVNHADDITVAPEAAVTVDMSMFTQRYENVTAPQVTGTPQVGATLSVSPGTWSPSGATFEYVWQADGEPISGETGSTFVPRAEHVGATIGVLVTARGATAAPSYAWYAEAEGDVVSTTPSPTPTPTVTQTTTPTPTPTTAPTPVPDVASQLTRVAAGLDLTGKPKVGRTIRVTRLVTQLRGTIAYTFQWYAGSAKIKKATRSSLKLTESMRGKKLKVKVALRSGGVAKVVTIKVGKVS
ncbi:carboxypeptidase regulatory-like domain-containing protein [Nocardioides baculatus]|uniref:alpha-amylase n=1 Tax=Nocardioides baculatus TaxID=2801337 RepID=A0ABS1L5I7_9ACTN|nr:carboxypeptidase regulatory-like domain-containing protein [Nocardioides baculatus]MBL0746870.1 carboxypeptidase regulatory-like domain-containing protein [Nocardioides baculatus]